MGVLLSEKGAVVDIYGDMALDIHKNPKNATSFNFVRVLVRTNYVFQVKTLSLLCQFYSKNDS